MMIPRWLPIVFFVASCDRAIDVGGTSSVTKVIPNSPDLDVLFVIDNSASTADKQTVFADNFPKFVEALDNFPGGRPNLHIGVVDTTVDMGVSYEGGEGIVGCPSPDPDDNGLLQNTAHVDGCAGPFGQYLSDIKNTDGTRTVNYTDTLENALSCIAQVGASGCGFEAPMLAIQRALDGTNPQNAGFLRPEADLAIVILTDEDDCSVVDPSLFTLPLGPPDDTNDFRCQPLVAYDCDQPISADEPGSYTNCRTHHGGYLQDPDDLSQFLATLKDPSQTAVALVAGDPDPDIATGPLVTDGATQQLALLPSCSATINGDPAIGRPGIRLKSFADLYHERGTFQTVCQPDYGQVLTDTGMTMATMMSPCLGAGSDPTDMDPNNPGIQPACTVADHFNYRTADETEVAIPACPMALASTPDPNGPRPCWWVQPDAACAAAGSELALQIVRTVPPPPGAVVSATCAGAP